MREVFVFAKRRVRHIRPAAAHAGKGILRPGHCVGAVLHGTTITRLHWRPNLGLETILAQWLVIGAVRLLAVTPEALGTGAVVLQVHDQRVVQRALPFKLRHDPANAAVHVVDHRRVHFHVANVPFLVRRLFPVIGLP